MLRAYLERARKNVVVLILHRPALAILELAARDKMPSVRQEGAAVVLVNVWFVGVAQVLHQLKRVGLPDLDVPQRAKRCEQLAIVRQAHRRDGP